MSNHKTMVFDEFEKAQDILKNGFNGNNVSRYQISVLAKYYVSIGLTDKKLKEELIKFCKQHVKDFNEIMYRGLIDYAVKNASKFFLKTGKKCVVVTTAEIEIVKTCPKDYAKLLFALIVLSKYDKYYPSNIVAKRKSYDGFYSNNRSIKEILRLCRLSSDAEYVTDAKYWLMKTTGYASPSRMFKDNWKVCAVDENSEPEVIVEDIGRLNDFFPFYCDKCGKILEKKAKRHNMCQCCYLEMRNKGNHY